MGKTAMAELPAARDMFARADEILGFSLTDLCLEGPEDLLRDTANAQPAIFTASLAALEALKVALGAEPRPAFVAGHSLGEFTALVASGALSFVDGLRLVRRRGELMSRANRERPGTMAAVMGIPDEEIEAACREAGESGVVVIANYNSAGQTVLSGEPAAVARAGELAKARGARKVTPLPVGAAFHSPLMEFALAPFGEAVSAASIEPPRIPVIGNVTASPLTGADEVRQEITRQVVSPVRWTDTVGFIAGQGVELVIEVGPGRVLSGLAKRVPGLRVANVEDLASAQALVGEMGGQA
jgi:[acyl-carrier-protein] S-malonyltransferase